MAEYDTPCACGHERRKHAHGVDGEKNFLVNGGACTAKGCLCRYYVEAIDWPDAPAAGPVHAMCKHCGTRPATLTWLGEGSVMDFVHGAGVPWCRHCAAEARLEYARKLASQIPELEKELADNP